MSAVAVARWPARAEPRRLGAALVLFVLSGCGALVCQVLWQRLLALTTGVGSHSVAIITAAFMAGLGIGSHAGGWLSARLTRRQCLLAFAAVELGVAAFAAASVPLFYEVLYRRGLFLYDGLLRSHLTHFGTLLLPTSLMGTSLPLLTRALVLDRDEAPSVIGRLYGANTLGAALGAALTPWVLLRFLGVPGASLVAAALGTATALGALAFTRELAPDEDAPAGRAGDPPPARTAFDETGRPFVLWVALYATSGFVSLSLEMAWFRVLDVGAKGAAFTFGTLLALYLAGMAAGTTAAASRTTDVRRPLHAFLACQVGVVLWTAVAHAVLVWLPAGAPGMRWLIEYGARDIGLQIDSGRPADFLAVYVFLPLFLFGPSTVLMGAAFPVLQRATQGDPRLSGRRVGLLQAANIAGATLGSLATGLVLLEAVGTSGVFRFLAVLSAAVSVFGAVTTRSRAFLAAAAALIALALAFPGRDRLWLRLHGDPPAAESLVEEDAAGVTVLSPRAEPAGYRLWINGRYNSWLPFGWLHTVVGAVPAIVHPSPVEVAAIGLGSGDTAWAAGCRDQTRRVTVFEIASSQGRLLARAAERPGLERLRSFLADPRLAVVPDDARRRLRADRRQYDVIAVDTIWHDGSLSTYLHSTEWFEIVKASLAPRGLMCVLATTPRVRASFSHAFPHVVDLGDNVLLGGREQIALDPPAWASRARAPALKRYLGPARAREVAAFLARATPMVPVPLSAEANRDLEPRDEFLRPSARR